MATGYRKMFWVMAGCAVLAILMGSSEGVTQASVLQVTPTSWNFGNVAVGLCSAAKSFTVSNTGSRSLSVSATTSPPFRVISQTPVTIPAGQSRTFDVQFCPTSTGTFAGQVTFSATGVASVSASLTGTAGQQKFKLTVTKTGTGSGTVTSTDGKINCGNQCTADYNPNASVTLEAKADPGSAFDGWGGDCSGMDTTCKLTMDSDKSVTARFEPGFTLKVDKRGNGRGTVKSDLPGINCGTDCTQVYSKNREVTLTATPDSDSAVSNWQGCDSSSENTCQVRMNKDKTVTVTFLRFVPVCYYKGDSDGVARVEGTAQRDVCLPIDPFVVSAIIRGDGDGDFGNGPTPCKTSCGNDKIIGTNGDDIIFGDDGLGGILGTGHDIIEAGKGNDTISGEAGNDIIFGGDDDDTIDGGPGDDVIDGGFGVDELIGGGGNDTFIIRAGNPSAGKGATTIICTQGPGESGKVLVRGDFKARIPFGTYRTQTTVVIEDRSVSFSSPMIYEVDTGPGKCIIKRG
jgi:Ca2+-binding RTX toxin-like protein